MAGFKESPQTLQVDATAQKAQSQEGKSDSGHIDSHQDSPATPDLILDGHFRLQNDSPKATLNHPQRGRWSQTSTVLMDR